LSERPEIAIAKCHGNKAVLSNLEGYCTSNNKRFWRTSFMMQQKSGVTVQSSRPANRFIFADITDGTQVVFYPHASTSGLVRSLGDAQLEYEGPEGRLTFIGNEIDRQQSHLGLLITVILEPDAGAGQLNFTLVLPPVKLGDRELQDFEAVAIKSRSRGRVANRVGAELTYKVMNLVAIASYDILPL
jgi:hypothetical protein